MESWKEIIGNKEVKDSGISFNKIRTVYSDIESEYYLWVERSIRHNQIYLKNKDKTYETVNLHHIDTEEEIYNCLKWCIENYIKSLEKEFVYYEFDKGNITKSIKDFYELAVNAKNNNRYFNDCYNAVKIIICSSDKKHEEEYNPYFLLWMTKGLGNINLK
jgi:hypothetical protein